MQFMVGDYSVKVREGRYSQKISFMFHHEMKSVYIDAPENLIHPVLERHYRMKVEQVIEEVGNRTKRCHTMRVVSARQKEFKVSAFEFLKTFEHLHGDLEDAKEDWDYNKAPRNVKIDGCGKFGDLKAYIEMRKGRELNLGGVQ